MRELDKPPVLAARGSARRVDRYVRPIAS